MYDALTDVPGILVGHAQDDEAGTGCTVVLFPEGAVTGADVRGGAPGTREIDSLNPENIIGHIHAVYLGGGSAYGLDGVSGVMQFLEENEQGFDTGPARVPIVPGAVIFDLSAGSSSVRPDKAMGYKACGNASAAESRCGNLGAGTGASIGKALGDRFLMKGGLGTASISAGGITVGALVVVNCFGDILEPSSGRIVAGAWDREKKIFPGCAATMMRNPRSPAPVFQRNTTLGIIAT
ncbi:MAG: peptidase S58 family protein, partial [Spirochaetales bacterium]